ncbi:arginine:ornithine antiporter / lysine permease [Paraburkholderia lycopersici]|uniref:Arginine:ornithine antiporter / lysine permease n=1 Tax=Paraburkholderia lycopersici TaxID=416944 RepID=A0A1G6QVE4_9BURK|nr:arginine:ornithine antiporter / lysine permease [Paraburkholderia lycopersici]
MGHPAGYFHEARQPSKDGTRASSGPRKLCLGLLSTLVVGLMIGGIFSLPQNMASGAEAGAAALGWLIAGIGMPMLALGYQTLVLRKPAPGNGVYAYARVGAGEFAGFRSARGYRASARVAAATR